MLAITIPFAEQLQNFFLSLFQKINEIDISFSRSFKKTLEILTSDINWEGLRNLLIFWISEHLLITFSIFILFILFIRRLKKPQQSNRAINSLKNDLNQLARQADYWGQLSSQEIENRQNQIEQVLLRAEFIKNYFAFVDPKMGSDRQDIQEIKNLSEEIKRKLNSKLNEVSKSTSIEKKNKTRFPFGL